MASNMLVSAYGTWQSPIAKDLLASADNALGDAFAHATSSGHKYYYLEGRASEAGRRVIVQVDDDEERKDILPSDFSVQSKIHEYGGAAFTKVKDGRLIFVDGVSQGVFYLDPQTTDTTLIIKQKESRFGDFDHISLQEKALILAVHEKPKEQYNEIVLVDPMNQEVISTIHGADFYTGPRFSHDGGWICWLQWNLEDMPWTGAQLFVAQLQNNRFINQRKVAGEATKESISQPRWGPDGRLYFVSDRTGYYKLYSFTTEDSTIRILGDGGLQDYDKVEFSSPEWALGFRTYTSLTPRLIVAAYLYQAASGLAIIDTTTNEWTQLSSPYIEISYINAVSETKFLLCGSTADTPKELVVLDITDTSYRKVIAKSTSLDLPKDIFSQGQSIVFPRKDGSKAYAWLWSPHNPKYIAPSGTRPPLIVHSHGGPTAHTGPGLDLQKQYWTTRGYSYASVNYGGSSGYGRAYRNGLHGRWGELDADDVAAFADYMCSEVCPADIRTSRDQVGITGSSAGGYTVLRALTNNDFPWKAGVSLYGIGNITMLEADTHKFESRYTRILFDPADAQLTDEERSKLYRDKSPQFFADKITAATLLLQGSDDKVVLLNQAEEMKKGIEQAGQIAKLVVYEGEGHGFRKADSIKDMLDQMEQWWKKYLVKA